MHEGLTPKLATFDTVLQVFIASVISFKYKF